MNRAVKGVMRMAGILFAAECLTGAVTAGAATSEWAVVTDGLWTNPVCWGGGVAPVSTNDIAVNVDGTYTSWWKNDSQRIDVGAIDVGTTTGSGTQTVSLTGSAIQNAGIYGAITIGGRGVFDQKMSLVGLSTGSPNYVIVRSGGVFKTTSTDSRCWNMGQNRALVVEAGGRVQIGASSGLYLTESTSSTLVFTNNGTITGSGILIAGSGSAMLKMTGSGTIDGPGLFQIRFNGPLSLGGTLTVNRSFVQADGANMGNIYIMDGANITLNGDMVYTNVQRAFFVEPTGASVTVGGSGLIDITFNNALSSFGGKDNGQTGTNTLQGTGLLSLRTAGNTVEQFFNLFTLCRTGSVYDAGGSYRVNGSRCMVISGTGGYFTMGPGTTLHVARDNTYSAYSYLRVRNDGSLKLNQARMEGNAVGDPYAVHFSDDNTAANLIIEPATTNVITGVATNQTLAVRLGTNAAVSVGAGSMVTLSNAVIHVAMTNSAQWGWASGGTIMIGTNVQFEALSTDHGAHVNINTEPFSIRQLAFDTAGSTLTLTNSVSSARRALYVKTLDLSAVPGGSLNLQGFSGAERVYYSILVNPNNVTFAVPSEWVAIPSEGTMVIIM